MQLDQWREDATEVPPRPTEGSTLVVDGLCEEITVRRCPAVPSYLDQLRGQARVAELTHSFIFAHRDLGSLAESALAAYLRDECQAKFVDISSLGGWPEAALSVAAAVRHGMRAARSLTMSDNDIGTRPDVLDAWCLALEEHPGLQHLSLRGAQLGDAGVRRISSVLRNSSVLISVDLSFNRIGEEGAAALEEAAKGNGVLLEISVDDDTELGKSISTRLARALASNVERRSGLGGGVHALHELRRARARAVDALCGPRALQARAHVGGDGSDSAPQGVAGPPSLSPIIFDERDDISSDLLRRAEAHWRYSATEQETLRGLHQKIVELKQQSKLERELCEETFPRITELQREFRRKVEPIEAEIFRRKEELAVEVKATQELLAITIKQKVALSNATEELADMQRDKELVALEAQRLDSGLKLRNREVAEEVQDLQRSLHAAKDAVDNTLSDNDVCRRRLHALRFETETERFAPATQSVTTT